MNRFQCPKCKGNQFSTNPNEKTPCIYCGNPFVKKMPTLDVAEHEDKILADGEKSEHILGLDLASGKDMTGNLLNPYGEYVVKFANNHGISINEAHQHPTCKARLEYFNTTGK